eukprot:TRINITY_DN234_c0_g1_i2.p3 TRINITY_DN234_c0_g1~~TRINITY_DN234_c0_g1_i2.p3  ORF type:complete len:156 (+),score=86.19 TRINITY_DN234_c0_g1_i2:485-952(+)
MRVCLCCAFAACPVAPCSCPSNAACAVVDGETRCLQAITFTSRASTPVAAVRRLISQHLAIRNVLIADEHILLEPLDTVIASGNRRVYVLAAKVTEPVQAEEATRRLGAAAIDAGFLPFTSADVSAALAASFWAEGNRNEDVPRNRAKFWQGQRE